MKKSNIRIVSAFLSLALLFSALSFNFSFAEEAKTVVINEVESSAPNKGNDWIELYNNSTSPVDISGWIISDDKGLERLGDGTTTAFPENTVIEAGGFLVFDVDAVPYDFGLGKNDAVNLYDKNQKLVDSYTYSGHAADTYGRYPDGTGDFTETLSTKGTANKIEEGSGNNPEPPQTHIVTTLRINEIETNHATLEDYVEIINIGNEAVDISGWYVMDDDPVGHSADITPVPQGTSIAPGALYVFDTGSHFTFGLGKNDTVTLRNPQGLITDEYSWSGGHPAGTWSRVPDGTGIFVDAPNSKGSLNKVIVINELESNAPNKGNDWIELYNNSTSPVDISGWIISDDKGLERLGDGTTKAFPENTVIEAGGFLVFDVDAEPYNFGLGKNDAVNLYDKNQSPMDSIAYSAHAADTLGRYPDGTGDFTETLSTKGTANKIEEGSGNDPEPPQTHIATTLRINEIETNHDVFADYVEIINIGTEPVDISGWYVMDDDPVGHAGQMTPVPAGTSIAPGALYVFDTGSHFTFGLGKSDTVTLRNPEGLITDEYSWSGGHPAGTWSRVPDGTGNFIDYPNSKGVLNKVTDNAIVINEIESNGSDRDWVEIYNNSENAVNITGWYIKDDSDDHSSVKLPEETILAPGGYFVFEADLEGDIKHFNFGLGSSDKVRLYDANGGLMDEHSWTAHATYGLSRIPNGTGGFKDVPLTKGSENIDADIQEEELVELDTRPWPGPASIQIIDETQMFKEDSSGLDYHGGALWLVDNGTATIWKLLLNNSGIPSFAPGFEDGKRVIFKKDADNPNAAGPDAEGITLDNRGMVYIASERDNSAKGTNYNVILQADPNQDAQKLVALREWNVTELIDNARQARGMEYYQVKSNMGIEAIEWIPNSVLNGKLFDTSKNAPYKSSDYSSMNDGLFFVGVEDDGYIYVFALAEDETPTLVSQIDTKLGMLMGLNYDELTNEIWAHADNGRGNVAARIKLNGTENPTMQYHNPPAELDPTKNNEGFAIANVNVNGMRPVYWVEDGITVKSLKMGFTNTYSFPTQEPDDDDDDDIAPAPSATIPANDGAVSVDYRVNNGSVSLEMPDKKVEEMIEKNAGAEVSIDASAVKNASAAEMPRKALADIAKAEKGVEVKLASGSITINKEAAASIAEQAKGESLSVEISPVKPEELSNTQKGSVKTEDIVIDINIISGERKISSFKGELEIKIPYDGPQPVAVWYLNDAGQLERLECKFENGVVTFKLNHLSVYVLGQDLARATIWKNPFSDVKDKDWFYASIKFVNERKLMNGVGNNRFNPGGHATRGMIATIIHLMEGRPEPKSSKSFSDVANGKYYDKAVAWAAESKILGGYGNGKFGPDDYITREQLASILNNYAKYKGYDTSAGAEPGKFTDEDQISPWALKSVKTMQKAGIMTGNEKAQFLAGSKLTRAEAAAAITKFIQLLVK